MAKAEVKTVMVRIRRMGKQWATCGIGVRPPEHMVGNPSMKKLCPKLVPGQVIRLPRDHPLLRDENGEVVERVTKIGRDEFLRPWVFDSVDAALRADPSKSGLSADAIADGLALVEGAQFNQKKALEEREAARVSDEDEDEDEAPKRRSKRAKEPRYGGERGETLEDDEEEADEDDEDDGDLDDEDGEDGDTANERRSRNRVTRDVKEDAKPVEFPPKPTAPKEETKPASRRGRRGDK